MSEIRLVRCPKCKKVLPEPSDVAVYQCGACGALLRSKKSTLGGGLPEGSETFVNSDKGREGEEVVGKSMEGSFDQEDTCDAAIRLPARSTFGDGIGSKSPVRESHLTELNGVDGDSRKSVRSSNASRSFLSDFDFDGFGKSPVSLRNGNKSPLREMGGQKPMSVRSRHASRSPMRDLNGLSKLPMRSANEDMPSSPVRGDLVSHFDEDVETEERRAADGDFGVEEKARDRKVTPKNSFTAWLPDDNHTGQSNLKYPGRRTWRDQLHDGVDQISEGRESIYGDEYGMTSEASVDDPIHGVHPNKEIMHRDLRLRGDNFQGYANSRESIDQWVIARDGAGVEQDGFSASSGTADGPSNYRPRPIYGYGDQRHNFVGLTGPASVQDLELERAELLREYKELKGPLNGLEYKRLSSPGLYSGPDDYSEDGSRTSERESVRQFGLDKSVRRPPRFNHVTVPVHDMGELYNYHRSHYDDPFLGRMPRRPHRAQVHQFLRPSVPGRIPCRSLDFDRESLKSYHDVFPGHIPGRSLDFDYDSPKSYLDEMHYHHPACSCSLCYVRDWQSQDLPNSLADGMSVNSRAYPRSSHSVHERHVPRPYNHRMAQTNARERTSLHAHRPSRTTLVTTLNKRLCHPVAGGSPFVLCCKCFQLVKLPGKLMQKDQAQLQCGACSAIMSFDPQSRSFGLSSSQKKQSSGGFGNRFGGVLKKSAPKHRREMTATNTNTGSYDFDAMGRSFQSIDSEPSGVSKGQRLSSSSADNMHHLSPASSRNSRSSREDCPSDTASVQSSLPTLAEKPLINLVRPPPGSPLQDHREYSSVFRKLQGEGKNNNAGEEKDILKGGNSLEGSVENEALVTEAEAHSYESLSTHGPGDVEEDKVTNTKDKHSSITAFMKWGFASKSGRRSPGRAEVYVNGQPISHRMVKRAEKVAGPIEPGEYWYDSKAGFWGVMGHQCLGIIPPSIQEFSFSMPENCSGGDTDIYVNGRELHKKDLGLLASRGLPMASNKRYIIDISGKVVEEGTREFVVNLGKLAPSVERKRCGYGMQVPHNLD